MRYVIERCPPMSLDDARKQAQIELGEISKGVDIVHRKRGKRQALNAEINGARLLPTFETYFKRKSEPGHYWPSVEQTFRKQLILELGERTLVSAITKHDIRKLIEAKEDIGQLASAQRRFALLSPFFKWCVERDIITVSPMADLSAPGAVESRDRVLTRDEIKALWIATGSMEYPFRHLYRLLLLTGQRREEVAAIEWSELDQTGATWTIPSSKTKNGKPHIVHLCDLALELIGEIEKVKGCPYLLSTTGNTPVSGYSRAKARLDNLMAANLPKLEPWRVHDLRRTLVSVLAELGIPTDVADRILNHVSGSQAGVKGVYQRYEFLAERKRAMELWGNHIDSVVAK